MFIKRCFFLFTLFCYSASFGQTTDSVVSKRIRPKDKSFSTFIVIDGLIQSVHVGLENSQYYSNSGFFNSIAIASVKYIVNQKHHVGLRFGVSNRSESYTKTDSVIFNTEITTSKLSRRIPINSNYVGYSEDALSLSNKNFIIIPYYEYHFKGNRRWDYYLSAEYLFDFMYMPKSKNTETLTYTNNNNDRVEYSCKAKKASYLRNQGAIATFGVNYFFYKWLSVGTKISFSRQTSYNNPDRFDEKLLVNGIDQTSTLNIPNSPQYKKFRSSTTAFLNGSNGGFVISFFLPVLINFYL